ncbi:hypothetical protein SY88_10365 [Clostridiales bacterium PH28_bin88]|nr:hypothetical protein SY88_10365 [Clostridiales bacterium PH28_bin88]
MGADRSSIPGKDLADPNTAIPYTIKPGDTLLSLVNRYKIDMEAFMNANPGVDPDNLQVGQEILIPICLN